MTARDFKAELENYIGPTAKALPHFTSMPHAKFLNHLAAGGHSMPSRFGYARLQGETGYTGWTMFFFSVTQGGMWDGTGILVRWDGKGNPLTGSFALCKHEIVPGPSANPSCGWHPGRCKHCDLDMSVDSSD